MTTKPEKILFLITKSVWGGAQRYVYDLATNLPAEQFAVVVALGGDGELREKLQTANVKIRQVAGLQRDVAFFKELAALKHLNQIIKEEQPDIIHLNSSKAGLLGALCGRLNGVPKIIYTAHGWAFNEDRNFLSRFLIGFLHFLTISLSHRTIAVSASLKAQLKWPGAGRLKVIHPGRSLEIIKTRARARADLTERLPDAPGSESDIWLGTIAELHPIKRLAVAIEAMAKLKRDYPTCRYLVIGEGEERKRLTKLIAYHNLTKQVFLIGKVEEAAALLPAFDIFILPSKSEAFGYVLIEAGLAGVPVIATQVGGIVDFIETETNGLLIPSDDSDAIVKAVKRLLENRAEAAKLAQKNTVVAKTFTVEKSARETMRQYLS